MVPKQSFETRRPVLPRVAYSIAFSFLVCPKFLGAEGAVAGVVGIEGGVVSEVFNLESSGVEAPDRRPRHDEHYHEA
jgi:hypothetical protein